MTVGGAGPHGAADIVSRLFFGRDDAEQDFSDGLLRQGFLSTHAYNAALTGRKSLIIGRKGSGKSAICRRLAADGGYPGATILITPDDAAGDEIRRFVLQGVTGDTAKSLIWRYVFAVHAARYLVAHAGRPAHRRRPPASVRALRTFLTANGEAGDERLYDRLRRGARWFQSASLSLSALGLVEASFDVGGNGTEDAGSEGARALRRLEAVERGVATAFADLGCAQRHPPLLFLVDQLEQVWTIDRDSHALITGLLLAAKHVTSEYGRAARCVLFLRSDIYDTLNFADGDKFHSDELRITWTEKDLEQLVRARASASLGRPLTQAELWGDIFPARMTSGEGEQDTAEHLFARTLLRPRDAIQLMTVCRDTAELTRGMVGPPAVGWADVKRALFQFSQWKLQDLAKEYLVTYPFLRQLFVLFENQPAVVTRSTLEQLVTAHADVLHREFPDYAVHLTPDGVIAALYSVTFLGVRRGDGVVYVHSERAPVQPGEHEFHVHPCFRLALGTRDGAGPRTPAGTLRVGEMGSSPSFALGFTAADVGFGSSRETVLRDHFLRSIKRTLAGIARSGLPRDERVAVTGRLLDLQEMVERDARGDLAARVIRGAAAELRKIAVGLAAAGPGPDVVARIAEDVAHALRRAAGGAEGSGQGSSS